MLYNNVFCLFMNRLDIAYLERYVRMYILSIVKGFIRFEVKTKAVIKDA